jgi:tetratricopeptide (TPR) repeat protein
LDWIYSPAFLALMGWLVADIAAGLALLGLARAYGRLGRADAADRAYRARLRVPLPVTRLMDALHGQSAFVQHERLLTMRLFGRFEEAAREAEALLARRRTPSWLRAAAATHVAEALAERGHLDVALGRLDVVLDGLPPELAGLRALVQATRLGLLTADARWEEAELALADAERSLPAGGGWPARRLALLLARDEDARALQLVRPLLEGQVALPEPSEAELRQTHGAAAMGPVHAARAAHEAGWLELRDRLVDRLRAVPLLPPLAAPVVSALQAASAAAAADATAAGRAIARAEAELDLVGHASGAEIEAGLLLVQAESRLLRHEAAVTRAAVLLSGAVTRLGRWRAARCLGEALEAAGRPVEAANAYRVALGTGVETRFGPELRRRLERLDGA